MIMPTFLSLFFWPEEGAHDVINTGKYAADFRSSIQGSERTKTALERCKTGQLLESGRYELLSALKFLPIERATLFDGLKRDVQPPRSSDGRHRMQNGKSLFFDIGTYVYRE